MATYRTICKRCERYALIGHANRRWYRVARAVIERLVTYRMAQLEPHVRECREVMYRQLCDLAAITSPRCNVKRNLRLAWAEYTEQPRPSDMIRSTHVALNHYWETGEIRGPKTSRFAKVLRGDDSVVVVDTWTGRALGVQDDQARNKSTQELAERVIEHVQRRLSRQYDTTGLVWWPAAETQAAVWAGMIRTHYKGGKISRFRVDDALGKVPF